jgi:hypothetical protein
MSKAPTRFTPPKSLLLATPVHRRAGPPPLVRVPNLVAKLPPPITYSCRGALRLPTQSFETIESAGLEYFKLTNPGTGDLVFDKSRTFGTGRYSVASEGGLLRMDDLVDYTSATFAGGAYNVHWVEFPAFDPASGGLNAKMTYTWKPDPSKPAETVLYYYEARCSKV